MESQSQSRHEPNLALTGEVRWYHVARSRAVRRILERAIERWLELHGQAGSWATGGASEGEPPRYRAVLQREGEGHFVHCQIEVMANGEYWTGSRVGSGIQQALVECLAHMTPNTTWVYPEPQPLAAS